MAENNFAEIQSNHSFSSPQPSTPLHLSGFLTGDRIRVQGDTEDLQFSVQFTVNRKCDNSRSPFNFPVSNTLENRDFAEDFAPTSSSFSTQFFGANDEGDNAKQSTDSGALCTSNSHANERVSRVTRLKSGVLSRVNYNPRPNYGTLRGNLHLRKKRKVKHVGKTDDVLEKLLQRRSLPARPCCAYSFFVMATWHKVKCLTFEGTSKKLGKLWRKLPHDVKKVYEEMAQKDNARYRRQCMLLKNDIVQEAATA